MKIVAISPFELYHPIDEELPVNQWVTVETVSGIRIQGEIGEYGLRIGDEVGWEVEWNKDHSKTILIIKKINKVEEMIEALIGQAPHIYNQIKQYLNEVLDWCESHYAINQILTPRNYSAYMYGYRFFRPDDNFIGYTANTWSATYTCKTEENIFAMGWKNIFTVPTMEAYAYLGWYCNGDLGSNGFLKVEKFRVSQSLIPTQFVYNQINPKYFYIDFDKMMFFQQQEQVRFIVYNDSMIDWNCMAFPILFRFAPKAALNMYENDNFGKLIDLKCSECDKELNKEEIKRITRTDIIDIKNDEK